MWAYILAARYHQLIVLGWIIIGAMLLLERAGVVSDNVAGALGLGGVFVMIFIGLGRRS
jgi:hypothetical protein